MEYYQSNVPDDNDMQSKYDGNIYSGMSVKRELSIKIMLNMFKAKDIMVLLRKRGI
jgi:hypothetical protein